MKKVFSRPGRIWILLLSLVVMSVAGCGVDWLPEFERQPTTPDQFTFTNQTGTQQNVRVTSNAITVVGLTAATSPIKVTGGGDSKYSINGGTETSADGTVKNGDKVTISHTSASTIDTPTVTTLQIGNVSATFTSWTRLVELAPFTGRTQIGNVFETFTVVSSNDANGHLVSITDTGTPNTAQFSVAGIGGVPTTWYTAPSGSITQPFLNGLRIFVRKESTSTTKLIIDNIEYPVTLPDQ